jgi:hypothetical protein
MAVTIEHVFVRREAERRLLMLMPRDPYCATAQSFNPFPSPERDN